jgi:glutamine synthetase
MPHPSVSATPHALSTPGSADPRGDRALDDVLAEVEARGVRVTRVMWCGNDGLVRSKGVVTGTLRARMIGGVGLTRAQPAQTALDRIADVPGMGPVGEMRLRPDPATLRVLPYAPRTAAVLADMVDLDGAPEPACPREFLRRMERRLASAGLEPRAGFENEFVLARRDDARWEPIDRTPCFSAIGAAASQEYTDALIAALEEQSIEVEGCHAEGGWGQNEIALAPRPALRAADEQILVREALRGVARGAGLVASLAPKPFPERAGNGVHVHVSLLARDGANVFADPGARGGVSTTARHFVAGLLAHLPGLCAIAAPSANSYRRLVPGAWAGAWRCWGYDNREAAVRACSPLAGLERDSANIEFKPCDASANPHLVLGALIAAGLDGIERSLEPPDPVGTDPAGLSERARAERGIARLPATPGEALDRLESDPVLTSALGRVLATSFIAVRRLEWEVDRHADDAEEFRAYFERY